MDPQQARMARAALKMSVREVGVLAKVSPNTVVRVEAGLPVHPSTILAVQSAYESLGVAFVNSDDPGVHMRKRPAARKVNSRK
jgi:hypothetical protein